MQGWDGGDEEERSEREEEGEGKEREEGCVNTSAGCLCDLTPFITLHVGIFLFGIKHLWRFRGVVIWA